MGTSAQVEKPRRHRSSGAALRPTRAPSFVSPGYKSGPCGSIPVFRHSTHGELAHLANPYSAGRITPSADLCTGAEDLWVVVREEVTRVVVDRARAGQILVAPPPAADGDRRDAGALRGFDVVRGVSDHHGGRWWDVQLGERRVE